MKQYLTVNAAARHAGVSRHFITSWVKRGLIPHQVLPGPDKDHIRIKRDDLDAFMQQNYKQPGIEPAGNTIVLGMKAS